MVETGEIAVGDRVFDGGKFRGGQAVGGQIDPKVFVGIVTGKGKS